MFTKLLPQLFHQSSLLSVNRRMLSTSTIVQSKYTFFNTRQDNTRRESTLKTDGLTVHILGNGSNGNARAVMISCDNSLYLFNCGEGTFRLLQQHKMRDIRNILFTSSDWRNIGGISSMLMYMSDCGVTDVSMHAYMCEKMKAFCGHFNTKLKITKYNYHGCRQTESGVKRFVANGVNIYSVTIFGVNRVSVAYICKFAAKPGELDIEKCYHMRIPRSYLQKLIARDSVTLEDGRVITAEEVHKSDEPESVVVFLDCPTIQFIDSLINDTNLLNELKLNKNSIACVVHFSADECVTHPEYQKFIANQFTRSTQHLIINETNPNYSLHAVHRFQAQLNFMDSTLFPTLKEKIELIREKLPYSDRNEDNVVRCQSGLNFIVRPRELYGYNYDSIPDYDLSKYQENSLLAIDGKNRPNHEELIESVKYMRAKQKLLNKFDATSDDFDNKYPEVVFLGTGAANPGMVRNVSAILVHTSANSSILMDCGEDTYGQLCRFYGTHGVGDALRNLRAVFITHFHSDHHMGLITLIKKHFAHTNRSLSLVLPYELSKWLDRYCAHYDNISNCYKCFFTDNLKQVSAEMMRHMKVSRFDIVPVFHTIDSRGLVITTLNNVTIVYSGDAEPSDTLIECGQNCDLLIHDATVEDALVRFARDAFHSTFSEAIDVARRMKAKFVLLTHFSQRYGKLPFINSVRNVNSNVEFGVAFDFLRVSVPQDLQRIPLVLPSLKLFYSNHYSNVMAKEGFRRYKLSLTNSVK